MKNVYPGIVCCLLGLIVIVDDDGIACNTVMSYLKSIRTDTTRVNCCRTEMTLFVIGLTCEFPATILSSLVVDF